MNIYWWELSDFCHTFLGWNCMKPISFGRILPIDWKFKFDVIFFEILGPHQRLKHIAHRFVWVISIWRLILNVSLALSYPSSSLSVACRVPISVSHFGVKLREMVNACCLYWVNFGVISYICYFLLFVHALLCPL